MKFQSVSLLSLLAFGQANLYGKCATTDRPELHGKTFTITSALTISTIKAGGKLTIIDGCNFKVDDFTFVNGQQSQWYASNPGTVGAITLSDTLVQVSQAPSTQTFQLRNVAGAEANLRNVQELRLFTPSSNTVIATVNLGGPATTPAQNPTITSMVPNFSMTADPSFPTDPGNSKPSELPNVQNGAVGMVVGVGAIVAALVAM